MALLELARKTIAPESSHLSAIRDGAAGVRDTLAAMIRAARLASTTLEIRDLAERIVNLVADKDYAGEIAAIQRWVRQNIRYTRDPITTETLKLPYALLEARHGDCDDQATLVAALAMSIGFPARFIAIGLEAPGSFEHVYAEVQLGTIWVSVETTEAVDIGWQPENVRARIVRHI